MESCGSGSPPPATLPAPAHKNMGEATQQARQRPGACLTTLARQAVADGPRLRVLGLGFRVQVSGRMQMRHGAHPREAASHASRDSGFRVSGCRVQGSQVCVYLSCSSSIPGGAPQRPHRNVRKVVGGALEGREATVKQPGPCHKRPQLECHELFGALGFTGPGGAGTPDPRLWAPKRLT